MALAEHRQDQVEVALAHEPERRLGLLPHRLDQAPLGTLGLERLEAEVVRLEAERIFAAGALEIAQDACRRRARREVVRPGAPVEHLGAGEPRLGVGVGRVEHGAAAAGGIEQSPEGRPAVETFVEPLIGLGARRRLKGEVDAVLPGADAGVDRWPGRNVKLTGRGRERPPGPGIDQRGERRQVPLLGPLVQEASVAELQPDDQGLAGHPHVQPRTSTTDAPRTISAARMLK